MITSEFFGAIPLLSLYPLLAFMRRDRSIEHLIPDAAEENEGLPAHQPSIPPPASSIQHKSGLGGGHFSDAFLEGMAAKVAGLDVAKNPYHFDDEHAAYEDWLSGWISGAASRSGASGNTEARTGDSTANSTSKINGLTPAKEAAPKTKSRKRNSKGSPNADPRAQGRLTAPRPSPPTKTGRSATRSKRRKPPA